MIKILPLLFLICIADHCLAQAKYSVCEVYCENLKDKNRSGLALRQVFNNSGKVAYEKEFGKKGKINPDYGNFYDDTTYVLSETFYSYQNDTLLIREMQLKNAWSKSVELSTDTFLTLYYYSPACLLEKTLTAYYGRHGNRDVHEWGDSVYTHYVYQNNVLILSYKMDLSGQPHGTTVAMSVLPTNRSVYQYSGNKLIEIANYYVSSTHTEDDTILLNREIYTYLDHERMYTVHRISVRNNENSSYKYIFDKQNRLESEEVDDVAKGISIQRSYSYKPTKRTEEEIILPIERRTYTYR